MAHGDDPTADLNRLMDEAGLDGSLLSFKGPFAAGVAGARLRLVTKLRDYIALRERDSFAAASKTTQINVIEEGNNG
jgi:hypothetical protein